MFFSPTITVHAKPAYVLGIDLGTSTTCIAIIKEDGTRQDIGIYEDDRDTDPCMPSVVAFARSGELLIGEKALRQAVVNPESTIYEVRSVIPISLGNPALRCIFRVEMKNPFSVRPGPITFLHPQTPLVLLCYTIVQLKSMPMLLCGAFVRCII